jgi:hypothetical protein
MSVRTLCLCRQQAPQTDYERWTACGCMLIGASTFAYAVSSICAIVASFGEESKEYVLDMGQGLLLLPLRRRQVEPCAGLKRL